jgi:hypothetical protein
MPQLSEEKAVWRLLNLRKASKLGSVTKKRLSYHHERYRYAAEIAARQLEDKYEMTLDRVFCDRARRDEFDEISRKMCPDVPNLRLRLAALGLRKARKLRPEYFKRLVPKKTISVIDAMQIVKNPACIPDLPGIYIIRDLKLGVLYIGEASNLRIRAAKHLDHSDRKALARYFWANGLETVRIEFHAFPASSEAGKATYRCAYEAQMIISRRPRFNIQGSSRIRPD